MRLLDIGAGAGFPGVPLKITVPELSVTLLEAKEKALRFLSLIEHELGLPIKIVKGRAEENKDNPQLKGAFDFVVGRAVAPMKRFVLWASPFLKPEGKLILQKGSKFETELHEAKPQMKKLDLRVASIFPGLTGGQKIIIIGKESREAK